MYSFREDTLFMERYSDPILLTDEKNVAQIAVSPTWQGRVMTSTCTGEDGHSLGWINRPLIESGRVRDHINVYGGEDRFWIGPEGGQFSIFFPPGAPFDYKHWQTPKEIDTEPFELADHTQDSVLLRKKMRLTNYSRVIFDVDVVRRIRLLDKNATIRLLGTDDFSGLDWVGFESENTITNVGQELWNQTTGMLSIWILGMFPATPLTTTIVPYRKGTEKKLGKIITDDYFGTIPTDRIRIEDGMIFYKTDGKSRGKIGIPQRRALPTAGSFNAQDSVLTIVQFSIPPRPEVYVNSLWKWQDDPFQGDVMNAYNDGPLENGEQLGHFYELESSSPAAALDSGQSKSHTHRTFHFMGESDCLDRICRHIFKTSLFRIQKVLS